MSDWGRKSNWELENRNERATINACLFDAGIVIAGVVILVIVLWWLV